MISNQVQTAPQRVPTFYQFTHTEKKNISKPLRIKSIIIIIIKAGILQKCINLNKTFQLTECILFFLFVFVFQVPPELHGKHTSQIKGEDLHGATGVRPLPPPQLIAVHQLSILKAAFFIQIKPLLLWSSCSILELFLKRDLALVFFFVLFSYVSISSTTAYTVL